jgi:hypothetical protein
VRIIKSLFSVDADWYRELIQSFDVNPSKVLNAEEKKPKDLTHLFGGLTIARVGVSNHAADISKIVQKYGGSYSGFISSKVRENALCLDQMTLFLEIISPPKAKDLLKSLFMYRVHH